MEGGENGVEMEMEMVNNVSTPPLSFIIYHFMSLDLILRCWELGRRSCMYMCVGTLVGMRVESYSTSFYYYYYYCYYYCT